MQATTPAVKPSTARTATKRIEAYDVARALAVLGMVIVNFKLVMGSSTVGASWLVFIVSLLEGRAAALFVILAGVGVSLLSRRARTTDDPDLRRTTRRRVLKRAAFLMVFGLLLAPIWPADILHFYSLYMLLGAVLLYVPDRVLLWTVAGLVAAFPVMFFTLNYSAGWEWETLTITDFWTPGGMIRHLLFNGFHPVFPWAAFLVFGMWLGRQDVGNGVVRRRLLWIAVTVWVLAESLSALSVTVLTPILGGETAVMLFGRAMIPPMPFYMFSAGSSALIGVLLLAELGEHVSDTRVWRILTVTGQFALTLYVTHIFIGMGLIEWFGWLDFGLPLVVALAWAFTFYATSLALSLLWQARFGRGLFESLMRLVADGR